MINQRHVYGILISAFISITLFEALVILYLLYYAYTSYRWGRVPGGRLTKPILLYSASVLISTILYTPQQIGKAIERGPFLLLYGLGERVKVDREFLLNINRLLITVGLLLIPVVLYRFYKTGQPAPLWGGWFEVGVLYSVFSLAAIGMFLKHRRIGYFVLFVVFTCFVFLSMRRSVMMGYGFTLLLLLWLLRGGIPKKLLVMILSILLVAGAGTFFVLSTKDARFKTTLEVIIGKREINEETLNIISTTRWNIAKTGLEVLRNDLKEGNYLPLLIGHGINSGYYLQPKSPAGGTYESVFLLSEFIEKGAIGLLSVLWIMISYYVYIIKRKLKDFLEIPLLFAPSLLFAGSVFTYFWDALLPLHLFLFRILERDNPEN